MRCDVYDQRGTGVPPLLSIVNPRHARRLPNRGKVRVMAIIGIAMIVPSPVLFWWDYRHGLALLWPTFIAINLLVFGLRTVHWAYMELEGLRQRERATEAAEAAEAARREPL